MLDVHMLLGKDLDASYNDRPAPSAPVEEDMKDTFDEDVEPSAAVKAHAFSMNEQCSYTLETMTPQLVHTGKPDSLISQNHALLLFW
jgi:hypothetical protein